MHLSCIRHKISHPFSTTSIIVNAQLHLVITHVFDLTTLKTMLEAFCILNFSLTRHRDVTILMTKHE